MPFSTRERSAVHSAQMFTLSAVALSSRAVRRASSVCANSGRRLADTRTSRIAIGDRRFGSSSASRRATSSIMSSTSSKKSMLSFERRTSSSTWLGEAGVGGGGGGSDCVRGVRGGGVPENDATGLAARPAGSVSKDGRLRVGISASLRCRTSPPFAAPASAPPALDSAPVGGRARCPACWGRRGGRRVWPGVGAGRRGQARGGRRRARRRRIGSACGRRERQRGGDESGERQAARTHSPP